MHANVFDFSTLLSHSRERYLELVRVPSFSVGIYVLEPGDTDHQKPHAEDEVYYIASGRAKMKIGSDRRNKKHRCSPRHHYFCSRSSASFVLRHQRTPSGSGVLWAEGVSPSCGLELNVT